MDTTANTITDDWASDPSLAEREYLILATMALLRLDNRMVLAGMKDLGSLPEDIADLLRPASHRAIKLGVAKISLSMISSCVSSSKEKSDSRTVQVNEFGIQLR